MRIRTFLLGLVVLVSCSSSDKASPDANEFVECGRHVCQLPDLCSSCVTPSGFRFTCQPSGRSYCGDGKGRIWSCPGACPMTNEEIGPVNCDFVRSATGADVNLRCAPPAAADGGTR